MMRKHWHIQKTTKEHRGVKKEEAICRNLACSIVHIFIFILFIYLYVFICLLVNRYIRISTHIKIVTPCYEHPVTNIFTKQHTNLITSPFETPRDSSMRTSDTASYRRVRKGVRAVVCVCVCVGKGIRKGDRKRCSLRCS